MFYVYLLKSRKDDSLYIGYTDNLRRRFAEHNNLRNRSTKYRAPFTLVYYEAYISQSDAKNRERQLKHFANAYVQLKGRLTGSLAQKLSG